MGRGDRVEKTRGGRRGRRKGERERKTGERKGGERRCK